MCLLFQIGVLSGEKLRLYKNFQNSSIKSHSKIGPMSPIFLKTPLAMQNHKNFS
uniref:Uncharacterized protein n=1 Tax=Anguilla anguilla TaxID=7936 RepID=A0A0E9PBT2_ANGAN